MVVYTVTHKLFDLDLPLIYKKIMVGAALGRDNAPDYLLDSTGDNISEKNKSYCELTGLYWMWKNSKDDIVGLVHYRRYFVKIKNCLKFRGRYFSFCSKDDAYKLLEEQEILDVLQHYDIIVKESDFKKISNKDIVGKYLKQEIWDEMDRGVSEIAPEYYADLKRMGDAHTHINCNMFIGYKKIIDEYCSWLFEILEYIDNQHAKQYGSPFCDREIGYMSEFLFGVWLHHNKINYKVCDVVNIGDDQAVGGVMHITSLPSFIIRKLKGK